MIDINLFAGAGGLAVGLKMAGLGPMELYEFDEHSCNTLRHNISGPGATLEGTVIHCDVASVRWRQRPNTEVRLLAAAAPCQPFSLGGKHLAEHDGRNQFPEVLRALRELRPAVVLLENVRGLLRKAFQPYFEYILRQIECPEVRPRPHELWQNHNDRIRRNQCMPGYEPAYNVSWRLVDAADYGVPQNRQRVFILATRSDLPRYRFPAPTHSKEALLRSQSTGDYWTRLNVRRPRVLPGNGSISGVANHRLAWVTVREALLGLPIEARNEATALMNHWAIPGARVYAGHAGSTLDWPSKTIKAGVHGVPGGENTVLDSEASARYFTLRETARLQTFPDEHFFEGARIHVTRQIGNAVPCLLAKTVATPLLEITRQRT